MSPNERRKARFLNVITLIGIPISLMFGLFYGYLGQGKGFFFGLVIAGVLFATRMGSQRGLIRITYLAGSGLLALAFLVILATGTGAPHNISWFYILPLVFFIFLELPLAALFLALTTGALLVLLVRPDLMDTHVYDPQLVLRFFIVYFLISLVAWAYEATRKGYEAKLERQNREIRHQKDFSAALLETLPNPFFFKDTGGRYLGCNRAFEEILGLSREKIVGRTVFEISPEEVARQYHDKDEALFRSPGKQVYEGRIMPRDGGTARQVMFHKSTFTDDAGNVQGIMGVVFDMTDLKRAEAEKIRLIQKLETALAELKTLSGMLPICAKCKKIRDDKGYWQQLETYIETHSQALFSHSICPACSQDLYGDQPWFHKLNRDGG